VRRARAAVALVGAAAGVLVGGTYAIAAWQATRAHTLPAPTGPYPVGLRTFPWGDRTVAAWYPAAPTGRRAPYLPASSGGARRRGRLDQRLDLVRAHALDAPPVAGAHPAYPLLLFSPGLGQIPTAYSALAEEMASHGYVVLGVPHPLGIDTAPTVRFDSAVNVLALDLVAVLDHVEQRRAAGDPFFARIDPARVGVFGHSFGGAASAEACRQDRRFLAGADLDGTVFGGPVVEGIRQPFLLLMARLPWFTRFRAPPSYLPGHDRGRLHEEMFVARSPAARWVTVSRLSHMAFADVAYFFRPEYRLPELLGARRSGQETLRLASRYLRALFDRYVGLSAPYRARSGSRTPA
jgi:dienelactone hydrolase